MDQTTLPEWIAGLQQRAPEFSATYLAQRQRVLADGAIPAKYKILMTMLVDAIMAHPEGVATIANRARAAGADVDVRLRNAPGRQPRPRGRSF